MKVRWVTALFVTGLSACSLHAAVVVTLLNGSQVRAKAQSREGDTVSLVVDHGTIELPASTVAAVTNIPEVVTPVPKPAELKITSPGDALRLASAAQALPESFIEGVAKVESALRVDAVSAKGAVGLMQLMPATAAELGVRADDAAENAMGGAKYLRTLLLRYNGDARLALAAYNAGPAAVDRYHGIPPYAETIAYVNRVLREYEKNKRAAARNPGR